MIRPPKYGRSPMLLAYRFFAIWYGIWFAVGLVVVGFNLPPVFGPMEDFLFMFLAGTVLLLDVSRQLGRLRAIALFLWVAGFSGAVETLGALTGFPFGHYQYTDRFGLRLFGVLPLAIPFAWWALIIPVQLVLLRFVQRNWASRRALPFIVGFCMMVIDLAIEPVATLERGYWIWGDGGLWYGVPWVNALGWFGTATVLSAGIQWLTRGDLDRAYGWHRPETMAIPLAILFTILVTFLLANFVAGFWLAGLLSCLLVWFNLLLLRRQARFRWRWLEGR